MGKLDAGKVAAAKAQDRPYKLIDGDGLQLRVATDGGKTWLVRYIIDGDERQYRLPEDYGTGPGKISLKIARERASHIRALARQGIDFVKSEADARAAEAESRKRKEAEAKTVRDLFDEWIVEISGKRGGKGRKDGGKEPRREFNNDVLPLIGDRLLSEVSRADVLKTIRRVSARGANRQAVIILRDFKQMIRWGDSNKTYRRLLIDCDVLGIDDSDVVGDYDPVKDNVRTRVLAQDEIIVLHKKLRDSGLTAVMQAAVWVMLGTGCRVGETGLARWEHIDFQKRAWSIPKENTKTQCAIVISLSDFVLRQFRALWDARETLDADQRSAWIFPAFKSPLLPLTNQAVAKALSDRQRSPDAPVDSHAVKTDPRGLALPGGVWKCHDLRRTAATIMQSLGIPESVAHRCLNHAPSGKLNQIYMLHDFVPEMTAAWTALGDRLDILLSNNVIVGDFAQSA